MEKECFSCRPPRFPAYIPSVLCETEIQSGRRFIHKKHFLRHGKMQRQAENVLLSFGEFADFFSLGPHQNVCRIPEISGDHIDYREHRSSGRSSQPGVCIKETFIQNNACLDLLQQFLRFPWNDQLQRPLRNLFSYKFRIVLIREAFPQPFCPIRPVINPGFSVKLISCRAKVLRFLLRCCTSNRYSIVSSSLYQLTVYQLYMFV